MIDPIDIAAPAERVWGLLRDEAQHGIDDGQAVLLDESRGRELLLEVRMGIGFRVQHAYRIERRDSLGSPSGESCQVSDRVRPIGWRWRLSNIFLFGRGLRPLEAAAQQGLRNLKASAEADQPASQR